MLKSIALALVLCASSPAWADDWPQFRGPLGQGVSNATDVPSSWGENQNIRWKTAVPGQGWSSPVVQGNQIWLTSAIEERGSLRAICVDRATGRIVHNVEVFRKQDLGRVASKNGHASPTPVLDGQYVFVHFGAHGTACLTTDGKIVWRQELPYDHRHGPGSSPVLCGGLLIVSCDGMDVQYTVALDAESGQVRWKKDHPGQQAYSTPLVIRVNGGEQLLTSGGDNLIAYAPRDGTELWRMRHEGHSVVPRPVAGNGLIYFCTGYWTPSLMAVRPDGQGDVTGSHVAFTVTRGVPHNPSPLLVRDRLYMVTDLGVLTCLNALTGDEVWRQRMSGNFSASPTLADGKIYLQSEEGVTYVLAPGDQYRLLATNQLDGDSLATPAFTSRAIYLRTATHLYSIESTSKPAVAAREVR